jgi:hypothetical protein
MFSPATRAAALAFLIALPVLADGSGEQVAAPREATFCFFSEPSPACRVFPITDVRLLARLGSSLNLDSHLGYGLPTSILNWELGVMVNRVEPDAFGAAVITYYDNAVSQVAPGVSFHYRRWLTPRWALDVSPAYVIGPGPQLTVGVSGRDWVALDLQVNRVGVFAGVRLPGLGGTLFPVVILGLFGLSQIFHGYDT